jgi:hypothetical protein
MRSKLLVWQAIKTHNGDSFTHADIFRQVKDEISAGTLRGMFSREFNSRDLIKTLSRTGLKGMATYALTEKGMEADGDVFPEPLRKKLPGGNTTPINRLCLMALQEICNKEGPRFSLGDIKEWVSKYDKNINTGSVGTTLSRDLRRLGYIITIKRGVIGTPGVYEVTSAGLAAPLDDPATYRIDKDKIPPSMKRTPKPEVKKPGVFTSETEFTSEQIGNAFIDMITNMQAKCQNMADKISGMQNSHKREAEGWNLERRQLKGELETQKNTMERMNKRIVDKGKTFTMGDMARIKDGG